MVYELTKWDLRFLGLARYVAGWSKDPSTKVGAVVASSRRVVLGLGFNGFPRGVDDSAYRYDDRDTKYRLVVHAEANAILNASGLVAGGKLYTWPLLPCAECAKLIIQSGITDVLSAVVENNPRLVESTEAALQMFREAGVRVNWVDAARLPLT